MIKATNLTTRAIVLRRTNYGEAGRILALLTPNNGQLSAIAHGVRREKSKLAGGIELFAICELGLVRSARHTDGLWTLTSSRIIEFYDQIMTDYDRLQCGYEMIKQIGNLSNAIETPELYQTLSQGLQMLNNLTIDLRLLKCWFYLHLSKLRGSELNLLTDQNGQRLAAGASYDYEIGEKAFIYVEQGGRFTTDTIKLLRLLTANPATILARLGAIDDQVIAKALYLAQIAAEQG